MKPRDPEPLRRWLDAERRGDQAEAESALVHLFRSSPKARPSAGFAGRVLVEAARLGLVPAPRNPWARFGRWLATALLTVAGLSAALVSTQLRTPILQRLGELTWTDVSVALVASIGHWVAGAAALWQGLLHSSESLALNLETPGMALTLTVALAMATVAFRALRELLSPDRSSRYVPFP